MSVPILTRGRLWPAVAACRTRALACGALQPIETEEEVVPDGGVPFVVRRVSSLKRKDEARRVHEAKDRERNPFLPPEADLLVGAVAPGYLAVLNKYSVIDGHLLIVTRDFVHQDTLLDAADFCALVAGMAGAPTLGFYNGGRDAGASQPHKHLQVIPLPLGAGDEVPMAALFPEAGEGLRSVPGLPFRHAFARLPSGLWSDPAVAAGELQALYRAGLERLDIPGVERDGARWQSHPYNLLLTRRWLLLVPRAREAVDGIAVNALGFAGSLFVRDAAQLERVKRLGPLSVLRSVAG
ncbi:MAG: phosphorylase [Pseudomonadota bacterium]|jgi:ATP adenylyltransferase